MLFTLNKNKILIAYPRVCLPYFWSQSCCTKALIITRANFLARNSFEECDIQIYTNDIKI